MNKSLILALALTTAACSGSADQASAPDPSALVTLAPAQSQSLAATMLLYGAAEPGPAGKLSLAAPVEALVASIEAPVGTRVVRGQLIARLTPSPTTRVDLAKAASDAQVASAAYARARRLRVDGLVSDADVETARAAAESASALQTSLANRSAGVALRASAAGVVDNVTPAIGDLVQPGTVIATISGSGDLRARFGVDPAAARGLHPGLTIKIARGTGRPDVPVSVQAIDPVVDPTTKLASVFARIPAGSGISTGETLTATLETGAAATGGPTVTVPYAALLDDAGQPYVYVVAGGAAHRRDVTLGAVAGDQVAILKGIRVGEQLVVAGGTAVEDGMKVRTK